MKAPTPSIPVEGHQYVSSTSLEKILTKLNISCETDAEFIHNINGSKEMTALTVKINI